MSDELDSWRVLNRLQEPSYCSTTSICSSTWTYPSSTMFILAIFHAVVSSVKWKGPLSLWNVEWGQKTWPCCPVTGLDLPRMSAWEEGSKGERSGPSSRLTCLPGDALCLLPGSCLFTNLFSSSFPPAFIPSSPFPFLVHLLPCRFTVVVSSSVAPVSCMNPLTESPFPLTLLPDIESFQLGIWVLPLHFNSSFRGEWGWEVQAFFALKHMRKSHIKCVCVCGGGGGCCRPVKERMPKRARRQTTPSQGLPVPLLLPHPSWALAIWTLLIPDCPQHFESWSVSFLPMGFSLHFLE